MSNMFSYFLSDKNFVLVVTLVGDMDSYSCESLNQCKNDINDMNDLKLVVLYFRDVTSISKEAITILTKLQADVRSKKSNLSVCSLKPDMREKLLKLGVLRGSEISDNLLAVLQVYMASVKKL